MFGKLRNSGFARILSIITAMLVCLMPVAALADGDAAAQPAGGTLVISVDAQGGDADAAYTVTITSDTQFDATCVVGSSSSNIASGSTIGLKAGQSATITGVSGSFNVTELAPADAKVSVSVNGGSASQSNSASVTVGEGTTTVAFMNTYEEVQPTATPEVTKEPEATEEPEATTEPEATATPEVTEEPVSTPEPEATNTPVPVEYGEASVSVTKAGNIADMGDKSFTYVLTTNGAAATGMVEINGQTSVLGADGSFTVPAGQTAVITGLAVGDYTLAQQSTSIGCDTTYQVNGQGWISGKAVSFEVTGAARTAVEFINTFVAGDTPEEPVEPKYYDLKITKVLKGEGADEDERFTMTVTFDADGSYKTSNGDRIESGDRITLKGGQSVTIYNLPEGTTYKVREREANENGYETKYSNCSGTLDEDTTARVTNTFVDEDDEGLAKTGDYTNTQLYIALMLMSAAAAVAAVMGLRRKHSEQ